MFISEIILFFLIISILKSLLIPAIWLVPDIISSA